MSKPNLTRYRRCKKCDGERLFPNHETNLIDRCDCREGFIPDDTLRQIADAWKTVANCGPEATLQEWNAAQDNLNALLIGLVEGDEDE